MKALKYIFLLFLGAQLVSACSDDFLEESNPNKISNETFWKTEDHAKTALTSLYGALSMNYNYGVFEYIYMPENWRSDEFLHNDAGYPGWGTLASFTNNANVGEISSYYDNCYSLVSKANQCIANIPSCKMNQETEQADKALIDRYVAEAKFFRAYAYFRLLKNFRNPPFVTKEVTSEEELQPVQVDRSEIWKLVSEDLTFAIAHLPSKADRNDGGATSGAAAAYLASVYMHQQEYSKALSLLRQLVEGKYGTYDLVDNYKENFNGVNENNIESVFEIQYGISPKKNKTTHTLEATFGWWGCGLATPWMLNTMQASKDLEGNEDPRTQGSLYTQEAGYENWLQKWNMDGSLDGDGRYCENNLVPMRYAEILLFYAEALGENDTKDISLAYKYINKVRERNNLSQLNAGDQKKFRKDIMNERLLEFCFEGKRWYDLVRWDQAGWINIKDVLKAHNKPGADNFNPAKHTYYPIPDYEYDTNPNLKRELQW
ncbi:MAG: RagB/SusD family nutrient uptake outer membrane protein [Marinifilaceae bacterium]